MRFHASSRATTRALARFEAYTAEAFRERRALRARAAFCPWEVTLVGPDDLEYDEVWAGQDLVALHRAWQCICDKGAEPAHRLAAWRTILEIGEMVLPASPRLLRSRVHGARDRFFVLLRGNERSGIPFHDIDYLLNVCQIEQGNLPIHAAGVIHKGALFLFVGVSGAGKSTVAAFGKQRGDQILDEDQVVVYCPSEGKFTAAAWRDSLVSSDVPLRAVFTLIQGQDERLMPLSQAQVARILFKGFLDITGVAAAESLPAVLRNAAAVARCVPGYELYFRASPDFWDVIDVELGY